MGLAPTGTSTSPFVINSGSEAEFIVWFVRLYGKIIQEL